ncbi:MAG: hypothetical protein MZV65_31775 [Chromatiales bacterium]|nr:hypothetical protein [Chromatiales bacterium]
MTSPVIGAFALVSFSFQSSFNVRIVTVDGEPWFMAKDVATALGYADTDQAARNHCKRAKSLKDLDPLNQRVEQNQELDPKTKFIPEPDVYRLITRSKLPSAEAFETWLFETVIPSIRKTGSYQLPTPEVETLSAQQYDELTRTLRPSHWLLNGDGVQTAIHDCVRVTLGVRHLKDILAAQFAPAMLLAKDINDRCQIIGRVGSEFLDEMVRGFIAANAPCTLVLARQYKQKFKAQVPAYPDWIEIQRQLRSTESLPETQA